MNERSAKALLDLSQLDLGIVGAYFIIVIFAGLYLSRRASKGISDYFLGGHSIPWWVMGASGTASNLDMTGTMVIVSFFYATGLQGFWVAMRGGVGLPLGILMTFMGAWLQRSNVMTTAEWMTLRFGEGGGGNAARLLSAISNLIVTVGFTVYFCKGTGKFLAIFLPFSPDTCAVLMVSVGLIYTMASGLYGVVYTDLIQEVLLIITAVLISYKAFTLPDHAQLLAEAGDKWMALAPQWKAEPMTWLKDPGIYHLFGLNVIFWVARGVLEGAGGFTGGYMPQRYYAAGSERQAGLLTAEWIILLSLRWTMVIGLALLGLHIARGAPELARVLLADPEKTLPIVLGKVMPSGFKGVAVAGLVAAAMSTFDSTINAGASYWVKDIYQRFINPKASDKRLVWQSYFATAVTAIVALVTALAIENINEIWSWITGPLSAGLFAPIVLRWYWWRFNGEGFAIATAAGLLTAVMVKIFAPSLPLYIAFPLTSGLSLLGGVIGSYATKPTPSGVVAEFYKQLRPFGLWGKVRQELGLEHETVSKASGEARRALFNTPLAMGFHLAIFLAAIHIVLRQWARVGWLTGGALLAAAILYVTWYKHLPPEPAKTPPPSA
ncbi:MAG: hypothetical protein KC503_10940 [Myxococcales bacterium]|nr:hypothetical protein [Myxococcales bacterium]